jgi:fumarylacetoacetate (FAA) hydrolase
MRLASRATNARDGALIVVSPDATRYLSAHDIAPTLLAALENWTASEPQLRALAGRLDAGEGERLNAQSLSAPLPRSWQWLDGSAFDAHGELMTRLYGIQAKQPDRLLMYQGLSHQFLGPRDDVPFRSEADGIDFEGEFAVITDEVPMGVATPAAGEHIKLLVLVNDWSLRALGSEEMKTGFGWVQGKPACSMAPFALTPSSLGGAWAGARVQLRLRTEVNAEWCGEPHGGEMSVGFDELIAHAAATRSLCAGTIIGSGTVSNSSYRTAGSACIAERRAIETLDTGSALTPFLRFGDRVRMAAIDERGRSPFGAIDQVVIRSAAAVGNEA